MNTAKSKPTIDEILAAIEKGERLGIDEALMLVAASKKMLDRSAWSNFLMPLAPPLAPANCGNGSTSKSLI